MTSIIEYWREIVITGGSIISFIVGRKSARFLEKKQQADAVDTMQKTYDLFLVHYNKQYEEVVARLNKLQDQFINLQLSYNKEIEISQNWQKLHSELEKQHQALNKKYDILLKQSEDSDKKYAELMKLYEKLKLDFERYKKHTN